MRPTSLYLITLAYAFSTFAQGVLTPIYAFFVQHIGGGILETSWAIATYSIITGVGTILIHKTNWSHTYRRQFLWGGWLLWLMSVGVYLIMTNIYLLYISQILNGLGVAVFEPIFDAEFARKVSRDPSSGWSLFEGVTSIFSGVASLAGGFIATHYGFNVLIYCMFAVAATSFCLIAYYTHTQKHFSSR
jgi:MFS family permease